MCQVREYRTHKGRPMALLPLIALSFYRPEPSTLGLNYSELQGMKGALLWGMPAEPLARSGQENTYTESAVQDYGCPGL